MYPEQQTLRDEVIRQWQPYGLVAAFWADQLVTAMAEFDRVQSLNLGQAASIIEEAHIMMGATNSDLSDEVRLHEARYLAFQRTKIDSVKLLLRLNQQAMNRVLQIQRMLKEIRRDALAPEPLQKPAAAQPTAAPSPVTAQQAPPPAAQRPHTEPQPRAAASGQYPEPAPTPKPATAPAGSPLHPSKPRAYCK